MTPRVRRTPGSAIRLLRTAPTPLLVLSLLRRWIGLGKPAARGPSPAAAPASASLAVATPALVLAATPDAPAHPGASDTHATNTPAPGPETADGARADIGAPDAASYGARSHESASPAIPPSLAPSLPASDDAAVILAALTEKLRMRAAAIRDAADPRDAAALGVLADAVTTAPADAVRQLPSAAREALAVCDDPWAGVAELARVCEGDLAVAQGLLRYANSALFARAGQVPAASLREAIDRVGSEGVRNVLVDVTVSALLCSPGSRHATYTAQVWTHAQRAAALARALAPAFGAAPDRAYAAGLLHDVGKLVLLDRAASLASGGAYVAPTWPALRALLVGLHEPLGAIAVLRWGMGGAAAAAVGAHHRSPPPSAPDPVGEAVYLAERVDMAIVRGEPIDLEGWWAAGSLTGSPERARERIAAHLGPLAAMAA